MSKRLAWTAAVFLLLLVVSPDTRSQQRPVLSPRDSVTLAVDTSFISVNYSRPSMRGRTIMGALVPYDKVWRTGANLATHLRTGFDMVLGGAPVPRGTYTLWTIPSLRGWKIILNKQTMQWGTSYDERLDLARFDARVENVASPVDTFTISLVPTGKASGLLTLAWENTLVSVPFEKNDRIRPLSPLDSAEVKLKGKRVRVLYSRPYARGRSVWGVVVPFDSVWRTGANAATAFTTEIDLTSGNAVIPQGAYTLYSIPTAKGMTLIVSKKPGPASAYDPSQDQASLTLTVAKSSSRIDPFRIWFEPSKKNSVVLRLGWADRSYSVVLKAR